MEKVVLLIINFNFRISDIFCFVGYIDLFLFFKIFKKLKGLIFFDFRVKYLKLE